MAANVKVAIDGDDAIMAHVARIQFTEAIDALDALVVEVAVPRQSDVTALVRKLKPGVPYTVTLNTPSSTAATFAGDVIEVRHARWPGHHRITLVGVDCLHRLHDAHGPATVWTESHADIAKAIAQRNGLQAQVEAVDGTPRIELQNEGSDALFLKRLAHENNYYVRVLEKKLHFGRRMGSGTAVAVDFDLDVVEIQQTASVEGIVSEVTVYGGNYEQDELISGKATASDLKKITGTDTGVAAVTDKLGGRKLVINQSGQSDASTAKARAKAELQARAERFVRGSLIVRARADARSGLPLKIAGAGWPMNGTFLIRQTTHTSDTGGYRTRIDYVSDSLASPT